MTRRTGQFAWITGAVFGAAAMAVVLGVAAAPGQHGAHAARLRVTVQPTGELAVERPGLVVHAPALTPGGPRYTGATVVRNQTARTLRVRLRVRPDGHELEGRVDVQIEHGRRRLGTGRLDSRSAWSAQAIVLAPLQRAVVRVHVQAPRGASALLAGRSAEARLQLRSEVMAR